jgi:glycosyltransferase involved in cell wall biosynthesis
MTPTPRVSIGVPVYNGARFLALTLDSLLAQTYREFEIIIGDNASTDRTEEICRAYAAKDPRVRYVRHEHNLGLARNYMRLLELARGELFRWAAADDLSAPEAVQACVAALDRDPRAILAYPKTTLIDETGKVLEDYEDNLDMPDARPSVRFRLVLSRLALCNAVFGLMRTAVLRQTRGMQSYVPSDVALLAELALYGRFIEVPERLFFRRFHPQASSALKGAAKQSLFTPGVSGTDTGNEWRQLREMTISMMRAPIPATEKLRVGAYLIRLAKWRMGPLARELGSGLLAAGNVGRRRT